MLEGLFKSESYEDSSIQLTFGDLEAKAQQITLRTFSLNVESLQDDLHGYCNLAGIQIRSFPELSHSCSIQKTIEMQRRANMRRKDIHQCET